MPSSPISAITRMNSTVKDLFIYLYDLSPLELDLLFFLIKNKKPLTMEELARKADRDKMYHFQVFAEAGWFRHLYKRYKDTERRWILPCV